MIKHWEHTETVKENEYDYFLQNEPIRRDNLDLPDNTAVFIVSELGSKRLEGIYDAKTKSIYPLEYSYAPNRDLRLYQHSLNSDKISILAVDGLMGTGKTSTCLLHIVQNYLKNINTEKGNMGDTTVLIAKPHVNSGGSSEVYGFLPGDLDEKLDPTLGNFAQYFDRFHYLGFQGLKDLGYIKILPLGYIRGLDAENTILIVDECQNTQELISVVTRKAHNSKIILLGDTSPTQLDLKTNTPEENGLAHIIGLLQGAPYFQYIEMKTTSHILRSAEVKDIVKRLLNSTKI